MQGLSTKPTDFDISSLPLNPDPKILHMDVLEVDKLEWTRDLPPVAKKAPSVELSKTNVSNSSLKVVATVSFLSVKLWINSLVTRPSSIMCSITTNQRLLPTSMKHWGTSTHPKHSRIIYSLQKINLHFLRLYKRVYRFFFEERTTYSILFIHLFKHIDIRKHHNMYAPHNKEMELWRNKKR